MKTNTKTSLLILLLALFFINSSNAQTRGGSLMLGNGFDFFSGAEKTKIVYKDSTATGDGDKVSTLVLNPVIGYFFIDNLAVGLNVDIMSSSSKDEDGDKFGFSSFLFGPFVRVYWDMRDFALFGGGNFGFGAFNTKVKTGSTKTTASTNMYGFAIGPGFVIFPNNYVGIEGTLRYSSTTTTDKIDIGTETINVKATTGGVNFLIAILIYLH